MATFWYQRARLRADSLGVSLTDIAAELSVTPGSVSHYFSGRRHPKPGMLKKIATILGVSVSELVDDDPSFARNQVEHELLEAIRLLPALEQKRCLAIIQAVGKFDTSQDPPQTDTPD